MSLPLWPARHHPLPITLASFASRSWLIPSLLTSAIAAAETAGNAAEAHAPLPVDILQPTTGMGGDDGEVAIIPVAEAPAQQGKKTSDLVAAPIPFVNPTIGAGLGVVGMYLFPASSPETPPSKIAIGGMASQNRSWGVFGGTKLHLLSDRCRTALVGGRLDLRYDYYGTGEEQNASGRNVPLKQQMDLALGEVLWRIAPHTYLGPALGLTRIQIGLDTDAASLPRGLLPPEESRRDSGVVGAHLQYDSRNDTIYPSSGILADLQLNGNAALDDGSDAYKVGKLALNGYRLLATNHVLGARFFANYADDEAPFYALPCIGRGNDLRGYVDGRYRDHLLVAGQAEWRWMATSRFGMVAFAGIGEVAPNPSQLSLERDVLLPSIGGGARWRLSDTFPMSLRLDVAWGKDEGLFYFSMGEAF